MPYSSLVLRHFHNPQYVGSLLSGPNVYAAREFAPNGDKVAFSVLIVNDSIEDIHYQVYGCPAMIACMSWLASELIHKGYTAALQLTALQISHSLDLPAHKYHCAILAAEVLQKALAAWYNSTH